MDTDDPLPVLLFALKSFDSWIIIKMVIVFLLLVISGMIAAAEIAFFSLTPGQLDEINNDRSFTAQRIQKILSKPKKLLATVLLSINFINIAVVILCATLIDDLFFFNSNQQLLKFLIEIIGVTFLLLIIAEVIPKVYANQNAKRVAYFMANLILTFETIFQPFIWLLLSTTSIIDKRFKRRTENITVDELGHALELTFKESSSPEEKRILEGIVKFGNTTVKQIMKSRMDMVAIDVDTRFDELIPVIVDHGFSRIPVYKDTIDKIEGILYVKDLLPYLNHDENFNWQSLMREPFFVPENKKNDDLLMDFKNSRIHMAVVVDEYGGTTGIVTLEDVLEEIVGDITDEFDDEDVAYTKIDERNYVFEGKTALVDIYRILKIDGEEFERVKGEADSLAGFLMERSGKLLQVGEKLEFGRYIFTVEAADKRRIKQVKITIQDIFDELEEALNVKTILSVAVLFTLVSCGGDVDSTPRPKGYPRIDVPKAKYKQAELSTLTFEVNNLAQVQTLKEKENDYLHFNIVYPKYKATIHFSYFDLQNADLDTLIEECHDKAYEHVVKAANIIPTQISDSKRDVHGLIYKITGNAATPFQFYATDSTHHFLTGSILFYARPNYDSIKPMLNYVEKDINKIFQTLNWKTEIQE